MNDLEVLSNGGLGLSQIAGQYRGIEKKFGEIIWSQISNVFPEGFDKELLKLDNAIANIEINSDSGDGGVHLVRIKPEDYNGRLTDLYEALKGLNGLQLDGFFIEIEGFNLNRTGEEERWHQINFRVKRKTKVIEGQAISVDPDVQSSVVGVLGN